MKNTLRLLFCSLAFCTFCICVHAQYNGLQVGVTGSAYGRGGDGNNIGGEAIANLNVIKQVTAGIGSGILSFKDMPGIYVPIYANAKVYLPIGTDAVFLSLSPGYGFYRHNNSIIFPGPYDEPETVVEKVRGGFYGGAGAGIRLGKRKAGYLYLGYSRYNFTSTLTGGGVIFENPEITRLHINAFTASIGFWIR